MSEEKSISRRTFLLLALGAGGAMLVAPDLPHALSAWLTGHSPLAIKISALPSHRQSARVVGLAYLQQYPHEADERLLLERLAASVAGGEALSRSSDQELKALLASAIRQDFAAERVVKIQGWILSATEARLCALSALV
jgi:hypothetical protein